MFPDDFKCVVIGDQGVGKTCLIQRYVSDGFEQDYVPTVKEDYLARRLLKQDVDDPGTQVGFFICDTGGMPELDRLRPLCYGDVDVMVLCFSVAMPHSYKNVVTRWLPEIKRHTAHRNVSLILVGTQADLRSNYQILLKLAERGLAPISECNGMKLAKKIGAKCYIECSSVSRFDPQRVLDTALLSCVERYTAPETPKSPLSSPLRFSFRRSPPSSPTSKKQKPETTAHKRASGTSAGAATFDAAASGGMKTGPKAIKRKVTSVRAQKISKLKRLLLMSCFA